MKLTTRTETIKEFILDEKEAKLVMMALDYVHHRQREHSKFLNISASHVDSLRAEIRAAL